MPADPRFIHVGDGDDLARVRAISLEGINTFSRRKEADAGGWFLLYLGHEKPGARNDRNKYSGHIFIIRCLTTDLRSLAETIIRERLAQRQPAEARRG